MEFVLKSLGAAAALSTLVVAIISFFVALYSFVALLSTAYHPDTSRKKMVLLQLLPFLIVTPFVQPPEKKKYADRFACSIAIFLLCLGGLMLLKEFSSS